MIRLLFLLLSISVFSFGVCAQGSGSANKGAASKPAAATAFEAEKSLADMVWAAHGGQAFKAMKTLVIRGSVDITTSALNQAIPAGFITIFSGDKYRIELMNPIQPFKQVYDGVNTTSTIRGGLTLPPINRLGFPLLPKIGETGFFVTSLPDEKKKKKGFRLTSPEGYFTDFYVDPKTYQLKGYDSTYTINGRTVTTSVEIDKYRVVEGISVPERYVQRFDTEQITIYATFKAKEIFVNTSVADDVFTL